MYYIIFIIIIMLMILFMIIMCVHVCTCMYVCMYIMYFPRGSFCVINVCPSSNLKVYKIAKFETCSLFKIDKWVWSVSPVVQSSGPVQ